MRAGMRSDMRYGRDDAEDEDVHMYVCGRARSMLHVYVCVYIYLNTYVYVHISPYK